jgi:hypothetical protein
MDINIHALDIILVSDVYNYDGESKSKDKKN